MNSMVIGVWALSAAVLVGLLVEAFVALPLWEKAHVSNGEYDA